MWLAAEVLTLLRDPDEDQSESGYSCDGCPETPSWQYSERNHLSVLIQTPNADLSHLPAEGVVALVQAVGDALDQKLSREELAQCCAKVVEMIQPAVLSCNRTKCMLMSLQQLNPAGDAMTEIVKETQKGKKEKTTSVGVSLKKKPSVMPGCPVDRDSTTCHRLQLLCH